MDILFVQALLIAIVVGAASGAVGAFIILRRMALVGDALSHVALPGIALALMWSLDPFWMVLAFLLGAAVVVWFCERQTTLPAEAIVGLLFTASLAIGILTIPDHEILESLFGGFPKLPVSELIFILGAAIGITVLVFMLSRRMLFTIVSPELAKVNGGNALVGLIVLLIFATVVAIGIKLVGTLLMGALTIIPAAVAKNVSPSARSYIVLSTVFGAIIAGVGVAGAAWSGVLPGPTIVLVGIAAFLISLGFLGRRRAGQ